MCLYFSIKIPVNFFPISLKQRCNFSYCFLYLYAIIHTCVPKISNDIFFSQTVDNPEATEEVVEPQTAPSDDLETESMDVESEKNEEVAPEEYRPPSPTMDADIPQADEQNTVSQTEFATKSPLKWTVSNIYTYYHIFP